jgi:hypothetical protein
MFLFLYKNLCPDVAEYILRLYSRLHVEPRIFSSYLTIHNHMNVYLFSVDGATIYADLVTDQIAYSDPRIVLQSIIAQLGRNKRLDFTFTFNNQQFTWRYRHTKASNVSEMYLVGRNRLDETSRDIRGGTRSVVVYDDIHFSCQWMDRMPENVVSVNSNGIIILKNEEPQEEDV